MPNRRSGEFETYHLTCPVCGALPGTSCLEYYQELERVHPSRRMSVAERNRRYAASGWEPPELVERRLRQRDAEASSAPPPGPRPEAMARTEDRRPRVICPEPRLSPGRSVKALVRVATGSPTEDDAAEAELGIASPGGDGDARGWLAAYLGRFPQGAVVPRWKLRKIASAWRDTEDRPLQLSQARQLRRRMEGRGGPSKGRRSTQRLAGHLRSFEELGLIRREHTRDAVIVSDPMGLRRLSDVPAAPRPGQQFRR